MLGATAIMSRMGKKKQAGDRHKPSRMTRVPERMATALEKLAAKKETNLSDEVKQAVHEYLEKQDLWPPKEDD